VVHQIEQAQALLDSYTADLLVELPANLPVFDVHTHLGTDLDGTVGDLDELLAIQESVRISRSFVFCLDEPDRHPAFTAANDRTLAFAARAQGKLIPFVRLDLNETPIEEATRCLDAGARGIKLHPRAQGFLPDDPRLHPVFELAADRHVPILIHGGRGLPPIAEGLAKLVDRYEPTLIIAHAGIVDLAAMAHFFGGRSGVFFDTSVWSPIDLLDLYRLVSPEQVLYASDYPYGRQPTSLLMTVRTARASGFEEPHLRAVLGESARRIADGEAPLELSRPRGSDHVEHPLTFARIHQYLSMAATLLWTRQSDSVGLLGLALNACDERVNGRREETERIRELLLATRDLWDLSTAADDEQFRSRMSRAAFRMLHLANVIAVTGE
jgi:predicted TIM-barrel fold metal-dependent hydrolase